MAITTLIILFITGASFAQRLAPVRIGMSRAELATSLPVYAKAFATSEPRIFIPGFYYQGMKGDASFLFMQSDHLLLFIWEHKADETTLSTKELKQYSKVIKGLEEDFGKAHHHGVSPYEARGEEYFWRLPAASGHTNVLPGSVKFQIADNAWLDKTTGHGSQLPLQPKNQYPYGK